MRTLEERFWEKVTKTDDCWEWTAYRDICGYGRFRVDGTTRPAHRIAYELTSGPIERGILIDHICHNPPCVKPEHLRPVTQKQNLEHQVSAMRTSKTGVRGVSYYRSRGTYVGSVRHFKKLHHVGYFPTIAEAEAAVIAKRNELFTHNDADRKTA